jgi:hypothetical protein
MKASLSVNFERFTLEGLSHNPGNVKLWESPGTAGGLPSIKSINQAKIAERRMTLHTRDLKDAWERGGRGSFSRSFTAWRVKLRVGSMSQ